MRSLFFICLLLSFTGNIAQNFQWVKPGNLSYAYKTTSNRTGVYVASTTIIEKFDLNGNFVWQKNVIGGGIVAIDIDGSGNVFAIGNFGSHVTIDNYVLTAPGGFANTFVVKYDSSGVVQWATRSYSDRDVVPGDLTIDKNGNPLIIGVFLDSLRIDSFIFKAPETSQIFVAKYSSQGNCLWAKHIESWTFQSGNTSPKIKSDKNGNFFISGDFCNHATFNGATIQAHNSFSDYDDDIFLAKFDSSGTFLWARALGGSDQEISGDMDVDSLGNTYISGYFASTPAYFGNYQVNRINTGATPDFFTAKYDPQGTCLWAKYGDAGKICASNDGYYTNTPVFISKYDVTGDLLWSKFVNGAANMAMALNNDAVFITGAYNGTVQFDSFSLSSNSNQMFLAKLHAPLIMDHVNSMIPWQDDQLIYPNPSDGSIRIIGNCTEADHVLINITNAWGQLMYSETVQNFSSNCRRDVDLSKKAKGIYFVEVICGKSRKVKKIILD